MLPIQDYTYDLPPERIAQYPLEQRDASKLLLWRDGTIEHRTFRELPDLLTGDETLFFNNTKVIPARLYFYRSTGGLVEVFLLHPVTPHLVELAMRSTTAVEYECTIGGLKRWAEGTTLERFFPTEPHNNQQSTINNQQSTPGFTLKVTLLDKAKMRVRFEWDDPRLPFAKIIELSGHVPIPPYLNRASEEADKTTYQTVYSKKEGAVAAPTAGLHFTPEVLERLTARGCTSHELTLHVSAGTFKPVKTANALEHEMHTEQVVVRRSAVEALLTARRVVAVGTTSLRTLESLYWWGVALLRQPDAPFQVAQMEPYQQDATDLPDRATAARAVLARLDQLGLDEVYGDTQIYLLPGYRFRVVDGLVTNFHQPGSTLMLLVAAFTGGNAWRDIYQSALDNGYRFLSYGDSSFLMSNVQ